MNVQELKTENFKREYGILCRRIYPRCETPTPFGTTWCVVEPKGATLPHSHPEGETFLILEGQGEMRIGERSRPVKAGDTVYIPAHSDHALTNGSSTENLVFLSLWWDSAEPTPADTLVAAAPPTPNGDLHLGHLSGPYIAADVYHRYLKLRGARSLFVTGSDDNQSYVPAKGRKLGLPPEEVVERYSTNIAATFQRAEIELDYNLHPMRDLEYQRFVREFFLKLVRDGKLARKEAPSLYCEACRRFLHEAHARGICPHCDLVTNANGCESCGFFNDGVDLKNPRCSHCDGPATTKTVPRLFFPLGDYSEALAAFQDRLATPSRLKVYTRELLRKGLPEVSASYVADWGIPVPIEGFEGQVIYEWVEMAAGYLYMARLHCAEKRWETFWKGRAETVLFFGFDNSFFYSSLIPALLLAYDPGIRLPKAYVVNEFYRLDGLKFSTSRNHAIWGDEILRSVPADAIRFYLSYSRPETRQTNFTVAELRRTVGEELARTWEGWIGELDESLSMSLGRRIPEESQGSARHRSFGKRLRALRTEMASHYRAETFSLVAATRTLCSLVREARHFHDTQSSLKGAPGMEGEWRAALAWEITALRALAVLALPILPRFSSEILSALGVTASWEEATDPLPPGQRIGRLDSGLFSGALRSIKAFEKGRA